jgi:hypothetical protein
VTYATAQGDPISRQSTLALGLGTELRLPNSPFSFLLNGEWARTNFPDIPDEPDSVRVTNVRVMAGIRLNLGTETLIERDRYGATLDPIPVYTPAAAGFAVFGTPEPP